MLLLKQDNEVIKRVLIRKYYLFQYIRLLCVRLYYLIKEKGLVQMILYSTWLFSPLGWRRVHTTNNVVIRIFMVLLGFYVLSHIKEYCTLIYMLFDSPVMSDKGYVGYTVFAACSIIWLCQLFCVVCFPWYRKLVGVYWERICMLNIVVLVILLSLFAQVGRIKFGIRVWFPNERVYDTSRLGLDFWG